MIFKSRRANRIVLKGICDDIMFPKNSCVDIMFPKDRCLERMVLKDSHAAVNTCCMLCKMSKM